MKKFASIFISVLLVSMMVFGSLASAASDFPAGQKGTLTLTKYEPTTLGPEDEDYDADKDIQKDQKKLPGAQFTAYKVIDFSNGTYKLVDAFANFNAAAEKYGLTAEQQTKASAAIAGLKVLLQNDELKGSAAAGSVGGLTYTSTEEVEKLIPGLKLVAAALQAAGEITQGNGLYVSSVTDEDGVCSFGAMDLAVYLVAETKVPEKHVASSRPFLVQIPEWVEGTDGTTGYWNYNVTASPKDDPVTLTKDVDDYVAAIGQVVNYTVKAHIPDYTITGAPATLTLTPDDFVGGFRYFIADQMSAGLTFDPTSLKVKLSGTEIDASATTYTLYAPFEDTDDDDTAKIGANVTKTFLVDFNAEYILAHQGEDIVLTYSAVVNEKAVIGDEKNTNTASLYYTDNTETPKNELPDPLEDTEYVYTFAMNLDKTFNGEAPDSSIKASGVEFSLTKNNAKLWFITEAVEKDSKWVNKYTGIYYAYSQDMTATYTDGSDGTKVVKTAGTAPSEGAHVTIKDAAGKDVDYIITQKLNPSDAGDLLLKGLSEGVYTLKEENSVDGYSKLASDLIITVTEHKDDKGKVTGEVDAKYAVEDGKDESLDRNASSAGTFDITINNVSKQFNLPLTGGAGLLMFTVGGAIVIAGAIIFFSSLRKKKTVK